MCSTHAAEKKSRPCGSTCACECGGLTWTAHCWLRWHATAVRFQVVQSGFLMRREQRRPHLTAGCQKTSSVCLTREERPRDCWDGGRERKRQRRERKTKKEVLLTGCWTDTFLFRSDSMSDSTHFLCFLLLIFFLLPIPSLLSPLSCYFGTRLSFSKAAIFPCMHWLCMLPSCGQQYNETIPCCTSLIAS